MKPDNPLSRQHYEDGCAYQVMRDCRRRCRQELEETCRLGVPVMREPNGGGHHHAEEFERWHGLMRFVQELLAVAADLLDDLDTTTDAARAYADLLANGVEPDYEAAARRIYGNALTPEDWNRVEAAVDAAIWRHAPNQPTHRGGEMSLREELIAAGYEELAEHIEDLADALAAVSPYTVGEVVRAVVSALNADPPTEEDR